MLPSWRTAAVAAAICALVLPGAACTGQSAAGEQADLADLSRSDSTEQDRGNARVRAHDTAEVFVRAAEGLKRGISGAEDVCTRGPDHWLMSCTIDSYHYYGADGDLPGLLRSVADAGAKAGVGMPQDQRRIGSLGYALDYYERDGKKPDGSVMEPPFLGVPGGRGGVIRWDDPLGERLPEPGGDRYDDGKGLYRDRKVIPGEVRVNGRYRQVKSLTAMRRHYDTIVVWEAAPDRYGRWQRGD
ncbi:hypothetical protein G5C51_11870 [Streptomyces sp. A7024]|uniref:Lipoprotein n=1 Tax=Streptomyces coryli TaxID=1128680 RepID=A0A6G4TZY8_9ACTN|nr:hypothetical protein [Streptomyces coryli]NGN64597.1 hypothetical protein [Streptomyces coryli]